VRKRSRARWKRRAFPIRRMSAASTRGRRAAHRDAVWQRDSEKRSWQSRNRDRSEGWVRTEPGKVPADVANNGANNRRPSIRLSSRALKRSVRNGASSARPNQKPGAANLLGPAMTKARLGPNVPAGIAALRRNASTSR
jgi:hypothetical protein